MQPLTTLSVVWLISNLKSKDTPIANIGLKFTGNGNFRETVDIGQRLGKDKEWGIRVNAMNANGKLAVHGEKLDQRNIFLNVDHRDDYSNSNLLAGYAYSKHLGGNSIFAASGNVSNPGDKPSNFPYLIAAPDGKNNLNPSWYGTESKTWLFALNHDQKLSKNWSAFLNAGVMRNEVPYNVSGSSMTRAINFTGTFDGSFSRALTQSASASNRKYAGIGIKSQYDWGSVKNDFMVAADRSYAKAWTAKSSRNLGTFKGNLYSKNDWAAPDLSKVETRPGSKATSEGINVVDTLKLLDGKLLISGGVHHQKYNTRSYNTGTGTFGTGRDDSATCPTYGIMYKITPDLVVYASHSETFLAGAVVGSSYKNAGEMLDPARTKSNEAGIKFQTGGLLNTLAFYRCNEPAYMAADGYYGPFGRTQYKGVEFSTTGSLGKKLDVMAAVGFNRYIYANNSNPKINGMTGQGIPKWNANLALAYKPTENWSILGRLSYIGSSELCYGLFDAPSYTRFDLGVKYKTTMGKTPVTFSAMCYNLTNKKGWYTADQGNQLLTADPRTFTLFAEFSL